MNKLIVVAALSIASCAAVERAFTRDPAAHESPAESTVAAVSPFLPPPLGDLAKIAAGLIAGAAGTHVHHKRKQKRAAADAKPSA